MTDTRELVDELRGTNGGWAPDIALEAADTITALSERNRVLESDRIEELAELIYLRHCHENGFLGAKWSANDSKDVWHDKARAALTSGGRG